MLVTRCLRTLPVALFICAVTSVVAQDPAVNGTVPGAVAPGTTIPLQINGGNLAPAKKLWLSFPSEVALAEGIEKNGENPAQVTYRVNVPATTVSLCRRSAIVGFRRVQCATGGCAIDFSPGRDRWHRGGAKLAIFQISRPGWTANVL